MVIKVYSFSLVSYWISAKVGDFRIFADLRQAFVEIQREINGNLFTTTSIAFISLNNY